MAGRLKGMRIAIAMTGSFCTFQKVFEVLPRLIAEGAVLTPILSEAVATMDTRFYGANETRQIIESICENKALTQIPQVEPIGPRKLFDLLIVVPCTGNSLAKLASGIADTSVTMAVKSQLRNKRPVLLAVSTNDALAVGARNIGMLMSRNHMYFVPFGQDDATEKPASMVFEPEQLLPAAISALKGQQLQPILL